MIEAYHDLLIGFGLGLERDKPENRLESSKIDPSTRRYLMYNKNDISVEREEMGYF